MSKATPANQTSLFSDEAEIRDSTSSTFLDNLSIPIHRWFRYSAGFSAEWVRSVIRYEQNARGREDINVFDPFAGSGTALLEGEVCNAVAVGVDPHPFVARVANAKLAWRENPEDYYAFASSILNRAETINPQIEDPPKLIKKCFDESTYERLASIRDAWRELDDKSDASKLTWLTMISIVRECSTAGTAQWQYVLPNKTKKNVSDPYEAFEAKATIMRADMAERQQWQHGPKATFFAEDARFCPSVEHDWADLIITSPPYANNYDYADATRLELTFLGEISRWADLQDSVRQYLVRSCSQHIRSKQRKKTFDLIEEDRLAPIRDELKPVCERLAELREERSGRKDYHAMVAAYFSDLAEVWHTLRKIARDGSTVCFVVGDSAPYGVHVPVDEWLGKLAVDAGFESFEFEKTRDRNVKWDNRVHKVPLHEGRLWIEG
jgi:hypothetical protein